MGISEIQALKARITQLENTHSSAGALDAGAVQETGGVQVGAAQEVAQVAEAADAIVGTSGHPEVTEEIEEPEATTAEMSSVSSPGESPPAGTAAKEAVETADSPVGTSSNPEVSEDAAGVEAIEEPETTTVVTSSLPSEDENTQLDEVAGDDGETADSAVGTSSNPEVEVVEEPEVTMVETSILSSTDESAQPDAAEADDVETADSLVKTVDSLVAETSSPAETSSLLTPDESTQLDAAVAVDAVETVDSPVTTSGDPEPSEEVEDVATAEASTLESTTDSTASSLSSEDESTKPDAEVPDASVVQPETSVLAGTVSVAETETDNAAAQAQLLADRTEVLAVQAALKKEKADIALVKAQLVEQIKTAATTEEELEAKNKAWLAEQREVIKHDAELASAHAASGEASKVDALEHDKDSLKEANKQLRKHAQQLQEERDSVVGELRRSVEQNEKMRELMEDIRDDQLAAAGEAAGAPPLTEASDAKADKADDSGGAEVFVSSEPSGGDAASSVSAGKVKIGSSDPFPIGEKSDAGRLTSVSAERKVSPILAVKHISKTSSSTILSLLGRMTDKLPSLFPGHGEFVHYIDELSPVARKADEGPEEFVISAVRNPCDWYVSLWAFSSQYDTEALSHYSVSSDPDPFFGDIGNATKFANWLSWAQGQWGEPRAKSECNSVMSLRYWEALKSGHHVGGINERGYNGATLDKYTKWFDGAPRERIEDDLKDLSPSKDVDCWVSKENMMDDLHGCLKQYEKRSGLSFDWEPFSEKLEAEKRNEASAEAGNDRLACEHYYTPELAESVVRHDRHMFDAFGYDSCCGARRTGF